MKIRIDRRMLSGYDLPAPVNLRVHVRESDVSGLGVAIDDNMGHPMACQNDYVTVPVNACPNVTVDDRNVLQRPCSMLRHVCVFGYEFSLGNCEHEMVSHNLVQYAQVVFYPCFVPLLLDFQYFSCGFGVSGLRWHFHSGLLPKARGMVAIRT